LSWTGLITKAIAAGTAHNPPTAATTTLAGIMTHMLLPFGLWQVNSNGCSAGVSGTVGWAGAAYGSVTINGQCYTAYKESTGTTYVPFGGITIGTCYQYRFPDISIDQSCRPCNGKTLEDECEQQIKGCTVCNSGCTRQYAVKAGDNCYAIAQANGMSLSALQAMNPAVNCEPLEIGAQLCVAQGSTDCKRVCEGKFI
jgi:hypothetical protein